MCFFPTVQLGAEENGKDVEARGRSGSVTKQSSVEMDQEKDNLVQFHRKFHVRLSSATPSLVAQTIV